MSTRFLGFVIIAMLCLPSAYAQKAKDVREYKERADAVRQEVWNWDIPAFKKVPALPANDKSSAVVIARHVDLKASSERKLKYIGIGFKVKKDIFYSNTVREMVKLNDKAALDEYSQFSFKKFRNLNSFYHSGLATTVVGVRIIKPDGTMKEVNVDEEIVNEEEGSQQKSKLAIPDLQVGDVIDYFVRVEEQKDINSPVDAQIFVLGDDKPILQYSVHCEISDKYFVRYRSSNGAPDMKMKKDDDGAVFDLLVRNIPSLPVGLWMSPYRQIPMIRMDILFGTRLEEGQVAGEVRRNPSAAEMKDAAASNVFGEGMAYSSTKYLLQEAVRDLSKQYKKEYGKEVPKDSLVYYVYYAFRYLAFYRVDAGDKIVVGRERNYGSPNSTKYLQLLYDVMKGLNVPTDFVVVTSRYGPAPEELLNSSDYEYMLRTRGTDPLFMSAEGLFSNFGDIASEYEGQVGTLVDLNKYNKRKRTMESYAPVGIPTTTADDNTSIEQMKIALSDDMQLLKIDRNTTMKGNLRQDEQKRLLLFEDYYEQERLALGVRKSITEQFSVGRSTLPEEYKAAFAAARKTQKDQFTEEIKAQFDITPKEVTSYGIDKMGLRHNDPDFVYHTSFTLDGLLKRAGNNYILEAGKLIGGQLEIKPEQRDRKVDIYMPYARSFENIIEVTIPKGYTLEGVDKLNRSVDNDCGSFIVKATVEADKLKLHIRKVYKNSFEQVSKWGNLLQVIDAAADFTTQKVLFKKA